MDLEKLSKQDLIDLAKHYESIIVFFSEKGVKKYSISSDNVSFLSILNNSFEAILITTSGIIKFINNAGEEILGFKKKELIDQRVDKFVFPDDADFLNSNKIKRLTATGELKFKYLIRVKRKNKESRFIEISPALVEWEGEPAVIGKMIDVTEKITIQDEMHKKEKRYRAIIENSAEPIIVSRNFKVVFYNNAAIMLLNIPEYENLIGEDTRNFIHKEDRRLVEKNYELRSAGEGADAAYNIKILRRDKKEIHVQLKPIIIDWEGKNAVLTFITDITAHVNTTAALRASEEKYRTLVENLQESILITQNGTIKYVNKTFTKVSGYSKNNLIDSSILRFIHPEDLKKVIETFRNGSHDFKLSEEPYEFRLIRNDDSVIWVKNRSVLVSWEKSRAVFNFIDDITEEKKARRQIRKLDSAIAQSNQAIVITDPEGFIEIVNPYFTKLTGYTKQDVIGKTPRILKSGVHREDFYDELWNKLLNGEEWKGELLNKHKDGHFFWVLSTITPVMDDNGKIINFLALQFDITERKKMEENIRKAKETAEKATNLKSEFLAQMSHEIRTPVYNLISFSSLIEEETKNQMNEELKTVFDSMRRAGSRLIRTVDLMINMSEVLAGTYDYNPGIINLAQILPGIIELRNNSVMEKNLFIKFVNNSTNPQILADQYTIEQIFSNLIDNAIAYTHDGGITISIEDKKDFVIFSICDTGIGIKEEYLKEIFEPFTQEEQGYTRSYDGTGLGLALVKRFCELNEAHIKVESKKNEGSCFTINFKRPDNS